MNNPSETQALSNCPMASGPSPSVRLVVTGLGHIPSKKNCHFPLSNGGLGIDKKVKERVETITRALLSALLSESRTIENATLMGCSRLSWIASKLPADDSLQWIPEIHIQCKSVDKGEEGFDISISEIL